MAIYTYTLVDLDNNQESLSFSNEVNAVMYSKSQPNIKWKIYKTKHIGIVSASNQIDWRDIPKHLNFVYRDSEGVWACQYRPKSKWFGQYNDTFRMYGGERIRLEYQYYHELLHVGDIFECERNTFHFIDWFRYKDVMAIKFIDDESQMVEIFDSRGKVAVAGSNNELNIIHTDRTLMFNGFFGDVFTFIRDDLKT